MKNICTGQTPVPYDCGCRFGQSQMPPAFSFFFYRNKIQA